MTVDVNIATEHAAEPPASGRTFNWLLVNFVRRTDGVRDAVAVSSAVLTRTTALAALFMAAGAVTTSLKLGRETPSPSSPGSFEQARLAASARNSSWRVTSERRAARVIAIPFVSGALRSSACDPSGRCVFDGGDRPHARRPR